MCKYGAFPIITKMGEERREKGRATEMRDEEDENSATERGGAGGGWHEV